ncbi:histidine phosphatase family protein [Candidatus Amesbacteria bacterium]|nr:histidine phosphatase family protein [Candidatus Amesbacteria bacterium]MBI2587309.1 histidine phosphatase family protein [Candidatus Amesbacteria bacterium]
MAKIYLVRHAQSQANAERKYQGQSYDTDLSDLGCQQAKILADFLHPQPVRKIVASPLKRAYQTAEILAENFGLSVEAEPRLIETNHGRWEGQRFTDLEINDSDLWQLWQTHPSHMVFPGGEAFSATASRVISWWQTAQTWTEDAVAVTHDNIIQVLLTHLHGLPLDRIRDYRIRNTAVTTIELTRPPVVHTIGDISHLADYSV